MDLALLNPRLTADEAREIGLVSMVFDDGDHAERVSEIADKLSRGPTRSYATAKRLMNEAMGVDRLDYHLDRELEALIRSADSDDFAEGISAFFEKREPEFGGR